MNWYFNNHGAADGPYDDADMRAKVKDGLISAKTLVWQATMEGWQETAPLNAAWWQPLPKKAPTPAKTPTAPLSGGLRGPVPNAPMDLGKSSKVMDFFKKLFKRAGKAE